MRRTTVHHSYTGSSAVLSRHGQVPTTCTRNPWSRRGFTLIEVVIAMSILVVVVLALLSSYVFYYRSITNLRIQSIGENLAQLQLEDVRNLGSSSFVLILGGHWDSSTSPARPTPFPPRFPTKYNCPNYPPAELFYANTASSSDPYWFSYSGDPRIKDEPIGLGNLPQWYDASRLPVVPYLTSLPGDTTKADLIKQNLASITYDSRGFPITYDSGKREADFVVEDLTSVPSGVLVLPPSISVTESAASGTLLYTLDISKWTYPYFKKRITITDESPNETELAKKLHKVVVTVYWTASGVQKSYTVEQEVGFEGHVS